ncbi:MAG: VWA domain-containing protein [Acidobacteriota bacterium]
MLDRFLRWFLVFVATIALALPAMAQSPAADSETVWIEVTDSRGRPAPVSLEQLVVREADTAAETVALGELGPENGRVLVWFDEELLAAGTHERAVEALATQAEALTALGRVELVYADPQPELDVRSGDSLVIGERLKSLALRTRGRRALVELRQRTLDELTTAGGAVARATRVRRAIEAEQTLVEEQQRHLLRWAAVDGIGPRLLILVHDGYDVDPLSFYLRFVDEDTTRELVRDGGPQPRLAAIRDQTARSLAALGWTVLALAPEPAEEDDSAATTGDIVDPDATSLDGRFFRPSDVFGDDDDEREVALVDPRGTLETYTDASGGEVVTGAPSLASALARFGERRALIYRSNLSADADLRPLTVETTRDDLQVRTRRWVTRALPAPVVEARLEGLLRGEIPDAGIGVAAALSVDAQTASGGAAGTLEVRVDAFALDDLTAETLEDGQLRVTVAIAVPESAPQIRTEVVPVDGALADWRYRIPLELPADADAVAVLVSDVASGRWGGGLAALVEGALAELNDSLPAPAVIHIVPPDEAVLRGRVTFAARVVDPRVARVDFLLDDSRVERVTEPPWRARVDLGRTPRPHDLEVIAYDSAGVELGRHAVAINAGSGALAVDIVRPTAVRITGPVDVEAELRVPVERRLDRVLFYWNNELVSTRYAPPFRQRVVIPPERPVGYLRVVALLDDGTLAEDVLFMNGPQAAEQVDVNLVELVVVVTDPDGRPVDDLQSEDFRVFERGDEQEIATFSSAGDLPLTLGLAIDSSASMFVKLPLVQQAASRFLASTFGPMDRAFVVDFDSTPRLARGVTSELDRLLRSIGDLEADGRTALWESVVFSLVQLQGVGGRKALVVFSDGADEDDQFPFRSALDVARQMGVPIYLILMKSEPDTGGLSLFGRSFSSRVERLVDAVGGRVFYAKEYDSLDAVYDDIEAELRSQYVLGYYPQSADSRLWREVEVEVDDDNLTPRTLSGYRP